MLAREKKIDGITDIPDYSDRHGIRVQIELRRDAHPKQGPELPLKHTDLRKTFGVIMLALVDGAPRVLDAEADACSTTSTTASIVVVRRTKYDLQQALQPRAHPRRLAHRAGVPRRDHRASSAVARTSKRRATR